MEEKNQENTIPTSSLTEEQKTKLIDALGKEMVDELIQAINKIESSPPTTKNHYGAYMQILSKFGANKILMANLLILMGANKEGVKDALKLV